MSTPSMLRNLTESPRLAGLRGRALLVLVLLLLLALAGEVIEGWRSDLTRVEEKVGDLETRQRFPVTFRCAWADHERAILLCETTRPDGDKPDAVRWAP